MDEAIRKAKTEKQFFYYLKEKGYEFKFGKDITIRPQGRERGLKFARNFGEEYTIEAIRKRILSQEEKATDVPIQVKRTVTIKVRGIVGQTYFKPKRKIGGIRGLYLHRRKRLRYRGRYIKDEKHMELLKKEIADISKKIAKLREEIKLCDGIAARSEAVKEKIKIVWEEKTDGKGETHREHIRRSR